MILQKYITRSLLAACLGCSLFTIPAFGQDTAPTPEATATPIAHRIWSIEEIMNERRARRARPPTEYCQGGRFKPCVCWQDVSRDARYRPAVRECGGNAAMILGGPWHGIFSVVLRDSENRDRWPASGFGNCTRQERDLGMAKCSAFKVQQKIRANKGTRDFIVHCFGASGYSKLLKRVVRATVKLADVPDSSNDPIVRWCLRRPSLPLN